MSELGIFKGRYAGHWDLDTTKNGDEVMLVDVELIETGEVVTIKLYQSEKAKPHSDAKLIALGWKGREHGLENMTNEVDVVIKDEEYQGKVTRKADIMAGGMKIRPFNAMNSTQKNDFLKRLTGVSASNGVAKKAAAKPEKSDADDIDIPF